MTGDGTIFGAETGVNELLKKPSPFIGLWLMGHSFDLEGFKNVLKKNKIKAEFLRIEEPQGHGSKYDPNLKNEIESTTLRAGNGCI